jgi:tetratricopeptide (TPR) repeat protein
MTEDLLELALANPAAAWESAEPIVASSTDPNELSIAYQARGIVLRDSGDIAMALEAFRQALLHAKQVDTERVADVRASYAGALYLAGNTRGALRALDRAAAEATGELWGRVLMRRAWILTTLGQQESALADATLALEAIAPDNLTWKARTLNTLGHIQLSLGLVTEAEKSWLKAEGILQASGHRDEAAVATHNLGSVAMAHGDIPRALDFFDRVQLADVPDARLRLDYAVDECGAYLAAGLITEAADVLERLQHDFDVPEGLQADLNLALANVHLAGGAHQSGLGAATTAAGQFRRQRRAWFELRARLTQVRARHELAQHRGLAGASREVARHLDAEGADEAPTALILAGQHSAGAERIALWQSAERYQRRANALVRASAWLACALRREDAADRGGVLRACGRGFAALDEHRQTMGSSELRALATAHGRDLADLALRHAVGDGRTLLRWSERWRATALSEPPVRPEGEVSRELAALRDNGRRLAEARADGDPTEKLEAERARLERVVRAQHHRRKGRKGGGDERFDIGRLVAEVGVSTFVELVDIDGTLHVLVVNGGKVRRRVAGAVDDALQLTDHARSAIRRAARGRPYDPGDLGARLQRTLLGSAEDLLPDGPVVISPTGRLHAAPWSLLPSLADRPFSLVPSAAQWMRARAVRAPKKPNVLLLAAPGLGSGGLEVPMLAERHPGAILLQGKRATVENAMAGLDGATLAHVAAHGHFRPDSPLFSSLEMADGSLSVYELERLKRAPYRLVLSACESGVMAPVGADELLGLASALFSMGTAGLVCSIAEVNDDATAALMLDLHAHLDEGLAEALLAAREAAKGDPTREATAAAFLALGV